MASRSEVLFVNGVNTAFGGSGAQAVRAWLGSLDREGLHTSVLDTVPVFGRRFGRWTTRLLLAVYFLPGTCCRLVTFPIAEILVKLSPVLLGRLLLHVRRQRPRLVVFSHHSVLLYAFLVRRSRRVLIVQDLLYARARSLGFSRRSAKVLFVIERWLYDRMRLVLSLSVDEHRILTRFCRVPVSLLACVDEGTSVASSPPSATRSETADPRHPPFSRIAIVADWRRPENRHGIRRFFEASASASTATCTFLVYGYASADIARHLAAGTVGRGYQVLDGGAYASIADIPERVLLVPIFQGAGIKLKVLEFLLQGFFVIGTPAAFIGLDRSRIRAVSRVVNDVGEIARLSVAPVDIRDTFQRYYFARFPSLGRILAAVREDASVAPLGS